MTPVAEVHVVPTGDWVGHDLEEECVCGPYHEVCPTPEGDKWLVLHHALDGRLR